MKNKKKKLTVGTIIGRIALVFFSTVLVLLLFLVGVCGTLIKGPSVYAKKLFTRSCHETSALKFVPSIFISQSEYDEILSEISTRSIDDGYVEYAFSQNSEKAKEEETVEYTDVIELFDLVGDTYKGKMMVIHDPKLVRFAAVSAYGENGYILRDFITKYGAIAGTNAGGFFDPGGMGGGGTPDGLVILDGKLSFGSLGTKYVDVIGFDAEGVLHVGDMTAQQALDEGIINGVSFSLGPCLVKDGVRQTFANSGVNPRTCIGQRANKDVLIATIEGRHPDSLGATSDNIADLMLEWGAINAGNLDGGSSTAMYYEGERLIRSCSMVGERKMPTALLVFSPDEE